MAKRSKRVYHSKNCHRRIVAQIQDSFGNKIVLFAHHAHQWTVLKESFGKIQMLSTTRKNAYKEYKKESKLMEYGNNKSKRTN